MTPCPAAPLFTLPLVSARLLKRVKQGMRRFLLLLLAVALIVVALAWFTGPMGPIRQAAPPPPGPGEAAWLNRIGLLPGLWSPQERAGDNACICADQLFT